MDSPRDSSSCSAHRPAQLAPHLQQIQTLRVLADSLPYDDHETIHALVAALDELSVGFARDQRQRRYVGQEIDPPIWPTLRNLWATVADLSTHATDEKDPQICMLSEKLAKFTRNLVAAVPLNQERAFENEPYIRSLIHRYTSFWATEDTKCIAATVMLVQALANIVTRNDTLSRNLWSTYMGLPQEQAILNRLLESPDPRIVSSTFVLLLNCIHGDEDRTRLLLTGSNGRRTCAALLDRMENLSDAEESSLAESIFNIGYEITVRLIQCGLIPKLYAMLSTGGEVVSPHQMSLLKALDAYLQSPAGSESMDETILGPNGILVMLERTFATLSGCAQRAVQQSIGNDGGANSSQSFPHASAGNAGQDSGERDESTSSPAPQDVHMLLPKLCGALILVAQCLTSIALSAEASRDSESGGPAARSPNPAKQIMNAFVSSTGAGLVEDVVETLRLLDVFLSRITFGKVAPRQAPSDLSTGRNTDDVGTPAESTRPNIPYIKRDLVRLLGVLCADDKSAQDRVRESGGIPVVMNLCVVDDQNPYLREHAIFALRNLLHENPENQAVVEQFKPVRRWDAEHVLQDIRDEQFT